MISKNDLYEVLKEWNIWAKKLSFGIKRDYYIDKISPLIKRKEILVLKGIRRCGKSTIMRQLMNKLISNGINKNQILFLNLEDYSLKNSLNINLLELALKTYEEKLKPKGKIYYFIDEIQNVKDWEKFLRTIYDKEKNIKFIITGSNASLLSKELSTLLTGRNLTIQISPLNYKEYCKFAKKKDIEEYLNYGGFPEVVLELDKSNKKLILQQYYEDIINKDIINRYKIRNVSLIFNLSRYLLENSGGKQSLNKLSKHFGVNDETISQYIDYLIDAFMIIKVPYFSYSLKKRHSILGKPKYYSIDNGFILISSLGFLKNIGKKVENSVLLKINLDHKDISYWANKNEVDFIYDNNALNVTSSTVIIPKREFDGLIEFSKEHKKFILKLLSDKITKHEKIIVSDYKKFLLE